MKKVLSRKLTYTYTGIIIAIIIASAIAFYQYNLFVLVENGKNNLRQFGVDTMAQVDMQIRSMDVVSVEIAANFDVINALDAIMGGDREDQSDFDMVKATIVKSYVNKVNIHRISIFTVQGDLFTTGNTDAAKEKVIQNIFDSTWYGDIVLESGRRVFLPPAPDMWDEASGVKVISLIRAIRSGDAILGYVEVQQKLEVIRNICVNEWGNENLNIAIVGGEDSIFYTNIENEDAQAYIDDIIRKSKINTFRVAETDQELICITDSSFTEYTSYLVLSKSILLKSLPVILYYLLAIVMALIVLSAFFVNIMTRRLTRPINKFVEKMARLDIENLRDPFEYNSKDYETEILNHSFKEMKSRLNESLSRQNALEAIQTKTLFNILQSEIGPHFLFNSLGSIANMCEAGESKEAADACYSLSEILRYAADYEESIVTVKEEADSLNAYLAIMKSRYRQRVEFETDISAAARAFLIPKLTFQPLVENAIKYSLTENESVFVRISAQAVGSLLTITVSDNGIGLSDEKKKEIAEILSIDEISLENTEIKKRIKFGGMGLVGTLMRVMLFAGKGFSYALEDNLPSGSIITIGVDNSESTAAGQEEGIR